MQRRGVVTRDVGAVLGLDHSSVSRWANGSRPRGAMAKKLAEYFGISVELLLDDEQDLPALPENVPRDYAVTEEGEPLPATPVLRLLRRLDKLAAEVVEIRGELADLAATEKDKSARARIGRALVPVTLPSQTQQLSSATGKPILRPSHGARSA